MNSDEPMRLLNAVGIKKYLVRMTFNILKLHHKCKQFG